MDLETIRKRIDQLEKLEQEVKINKEMLKGELENEASYLEVVEESKLTAQKKKQIKDEILGKGSNQEGQKNIKDTQEEIATIREILSAELTEFYQENQTDQVANRKFKITAKLLPKKDNYQDRDDTGRYVPAEN
jgi:hypothetical protein